MMPQISDCLLVPTQIKIKKSRRNIKVPKNEMAFIKSLSISVDVNS